MPCYAPLKGWKSATTTENGKRQIVFNRKYALVDMPVEVPCGQCIGCRLERSRQWALRCVHEAQLHSDNCFLTLTYSDENIPKNANLDITHFQKFMKRLRKKISPKKVRFFHCGEYGENDPTNLKHQQTYGVSKLGRPHYHALLFGHNFNDRVLFKDDGDVKLYISDELNQLWKLGHCSIGNVTFESAAYCARYVTKKVNGQKKEEHYKRIYLNKEVIINEEYITMSRRPGIGTEWYKKFKKDVYPKDFTTVRGKRIKPPKFYDNILERENEKLYQEIKSSRIKSAKDRASDNTPDRLIQKETVKKAQANMLKRNLED